MNNSLKRMIILSIVAALYAVLTVVNPFSYGNIQFRVSEILVLLCFYRKDYSIALILGCAIANIFSPLGFTDVVFGTLATAISVILIMSSRNLYIASIYPVFFNATIVGLELYYVIGLPLFRSMYEVAAGEFVVIGIGVLLFKTLEKNREFLRLIDADQNIRL